jgi:hypothetical protein
MMGKGRGRLSAIELLPDEAHPDVAWAIGELNARKRTAESIRLELNERLLALGCDPVQRSSFNRYSLNIAKQGMAMQQLRGVAAIIAEKMDEEPDGDVGLLINETIKTLIYDVIMEGSLSEEGMSIDMLKKAADAVYRLESARSTNLKAAAFKRAKFITQAADTAEKAAKEAGLSADRAAQIRRDVLGVRDAK